MGRLWLGGWGSKEAVEETGRGEGCHEADHVGVVVVGVDVGVW